MKPCQVGGQRSTLNGPSCFCQRARSATCEEQTEVAALRRNRFGCVVTVEACGFPPEIRWPVVRRRPVSGFRQLYGIIKKGILQPCESVRVSSCAISHLGFRHFQGTDDNARSGKAEN